MRDVGREVVGLYECKRTCLSGIHERFRVCVNVSDSGDNPCGMVGRSEVIKDATEVPHRDRS